MTRVIGNNGYWFSISFHNLFFSQGKEIDLRGIKGKCSILVSCNNMKKLLKMGQKHVISQLCSLYVQIFVSSTPLDSKKLSIIILKYLERCLRVFHLPKTITITLICILEVNRLTLGFIGIFMHKWVRFGIWFMIC